MESTASNAKTSEELQIRLDQTEATDGKNEIVFVITFTGAINKANVFTIPLMQRLDALLDKVEEAAITKKKNPCALILIGAGSFFSAGFDLKSLTGKSLSEQKREKRTPSEREDSSLNPTPQGQELVQLSWRVLARLLIFPVPTISVFNGHAYGLGFFIGMACDHRIMIEPSGNSKKGFFLCLPEITIGLPLGEGFAALAKCKLPMKALRDSALTGKQWASQEAKDYGIIDAIVPFPIGSISSPGNKSEIQLAWVPPEAIKMAKRLAPTSTKGNLSKIKLEIYGDAYAILSRAISKL